MFNFVNVYVNVLLVTVALVIIYLTMCQLFITVLVVLRVLKS